MTTTTASTLPAGVVLRAMGWYDLERLAELEREMFPDDAWTEASWWSELAGRPRREYLVLTADPASAAGGSENGEDDTDDDGPEILAYAGLDHGGDLADVMTIAVAPAGRRQGLATVLLAELVARARVRGADHLMLEVRADNTAALALYDRAGFTTISTRRRYYAGDVDAHVMRLTLEGPTS